MKTRVVTIDRQAGTALDEIAGRVARELGFRVFDREVFAAAAAEAGVSPWTIDNCTRHHSRIDRLIEAFASSPRLALETGVGAMAAPVSPPVVNLSDCRRLVEEMILRIADDGDAVVVGHGAQFVLAGRADTLRVFVTAPEACRARRLALQSGIDEDEALRKVRESDRERISYFKECHAEGWLAPSTYDLCLGLDNMNLATAACLIAAAARER